MKRSKVFISYRRMDSAGMCDRIYARLVEVFGRDAIFKDIDAIPLGVNFEAYIKDAIAESAIALVVIGRSWLNIQSVTGGRRLDDPSDPVRIEIEEALKSNIPVILLMVDGADLPSSEQLPESLRPLVKQNGRKINVDPYFDVDMQRLTKEIQNWLSTIAAQQRQAEPAQAAARPAAAPQPSQGVVTPPLSLPKLRISLFGMVALLSGLLVIGLLAGLASGLI
jgi:hypothetical protein